ncbi:MAG: beta-galactosidase, partial [Bacteroidota bacterium]|nr:beta-galactosidase [Bacteroidota bacterium]
MKRIFITILSVLATAGLSGQSVTRLEEGWKFAYGNAADPAKDFGRGTEYFNYLTKAASIHNEGPYALIFDDSDWKEVRVPHDWAATLPYDSLASHSHGYKTVGWKYPETSVGWYLLRLPASAFREGRTYELRFDGIFRDANVWFNGFWMGNEPSGYAVQVFDITPYIDYGGENLLCVRADASFEEGWFYEGAGIYRPVWLLEKGPVHPTEGGIRTHWEPDELTVAVDLRNSGAKTGDFALEPTNKDNSRANQVSFALEVKIRLLDSDGKQVCAGSIPCRLRPGETAKFQGSLRLERPHFWDVDDPYLYTLETCIGEDVYRTPVGIRTAE